jgi:hypothetical protein
VKVYGWKLTVQQGSWDGQTHREKSVQNSTLFVIFDFLSRGKPSELDVIHIFQEKKRIGFSSCMMHQLHGNK